MRKIDSYKRLDDHYLNWYEGFISFLAVVGAPGLAKSYYYENLLAHDEYTLFRGHTSALKIYIEVYDHPDRRIVFDDVGQLLRAPACVDLMKSLCDTRPRRTVHWHTTTPLLEGRNDEFNTSAPVLMVCNRNLLANEDVKAILDRANAVEFCPSKAEIIRKLRSYADDQEIVDFLEVMPIRPTLRTYELARDLKKSPRGNWRQEVMDECGVEKHIQNLVHIIQTEAPEKWLECYHDQTKRSRRDYYNCLPLAKELAAAAMEKSGALLFSPERNVEGQVYER